MDYSKAVVMNSYFGDELTEQFETCQLRAYQDSGGVWTIAWGHTRGVAKGLTCCMAQANEWWKEDVGFATAAVNDLVKVPLSQGEFNALVDFVFNIGIGSFTDSSLLILLNSGEYQGAAAEIDKLSTQKRWDHSRFCSCVGNLAVCAGLLRRREAAREAETREFQERAD